MPEHDEETAPRPSRHRRHNQVWIGLFVLLGVGAGLSLAFVMTEPALLRGRYVVTTYVDDAGGIRKGDPVQLKGVVVGRVSGFAIDARSNRVEIKLEIEKGRYRIPRDSHVEIQSRSIYGEKAAVVVAGRSEESVRSGDVLPGRLVRDLFGGGAEVAREVQDVVSRVRELLADETLANVQSSAAELHGLLEQLDDIATEQRGELRGLTQSLHRSARALEGAATRPELESAIRRSDAVMADLQRASQSLDASSQSLENVLGRLERGEGSLGKLLKDDAVYENLNQALRNASMLAEDIRARPGRYVKLSVF